MNNNIFSTINDDYYMLFPYNHHFNSSQSFLPFTSSSSSSSINDILIQSTSNNHLQPSPFSQFEPLPDFDILTSYLTPNNGNGDYTYQTIPSHHPSLPLTITHIEDSQRISTSQNATMKKVKKPSRTDRHSKIKTAKGTRDRRMRLSLDVAKELFGLQDMLGFDKASKTVEWLLTKAKPEIIKVAKSQSHPCWSSSGDESQNRPALGSMDTSSDLCELASIWTVNDRDSNINTTETREKRVDGRSMRGKRKRSEPRTPILKKLSKDERAKARERAKDRTKEKMMKRRSQFVEIVDEEAHDHGHGHGHEMMKNNKSEVNPSSFEVTQYCEEEIGEFCMNDRFAACNDYVMNKQNHISNYDVINKLNSSLPLLNHHQGAANSIEQQQLTDLHHYLRKPRDLMYNYQNMC